MFLLNSHSCPFHDSIQNMNQILPKLLCHLAEFLNNTSLKSFMFLHSHTRVGLITVYLNFIFYSSCSSKEILITSFDTISNIFFSISFCFHIYLRHCFSLSMLHIFLKRLMLSDRNPFLSLSPYSYQHFFS